MMASLFCLFFFLYVRLFPILSLASSLSFFLLHLRHLLLSLPLLFPLSPPLLFVTSISHSLARLFPLLKIISRNIEPSSLRMRIVVFKALGDLRVMPHHADFSTDFHVGFCYGVVPSHSLSDVFSLLSTPPTAVSSDRRPLV